jgi:membrane protease YdiL (CAAX protease family)
VNGRLIAWFSFVAAFSALNYVARFLSGPVDNTQVAYQYSSAVGGLVEYALVFGIVLLISRGTSLRETFALRRPRSWGRAIAISFGVLAAVIVVSAVVSPFGNAGKEQGLTPTAWNSHRVAQFAAFAFVVAVIGPVVEELTFRGLGYSLLEPYGRTFAILVVGLAFGLVHGLLIGLPVIAAFGTGLAYLRSRSESIYPCVLLHAFFNGAALALSVSA